MALDNKSKIHTVSCPHCNKQRLVSRRIVKRIENKESDGICRSCSNSISLKGNNHLLGHKHSKDTKEKMSLASMGKKKTLQHKLNISKGRKGIKFSLEHRKNLSKALKGTRTGENSPNWKGGVSSLNKLERSKFNSEMQKKVLERDDFTCQICNARGCALQADHIQGWKDYPELRFDINNCRTLCMSCHYKITYNRDMPKSVKAWGHNLSRMKV